jgi:hypothetical protein
MGEPQGSTQARLSRTRQRLAALEYREPLDASSLSLVSRLLNDLVAATDAFEQLQRREVSDPLPLRLGNQPR